MKLEFRLHRATGAAVRDDLASVSEFHTDSGQEPADASGTSRGNAVQLAAEVAKDPKWRPTAASFASLVWRRFPVFGLLMLGLIAVMDGLS